MSNHPVAWQTPQPLWARFGASAADQAGPAILRFAGDDFMDQMLGTLARDPSRLDALLARPETWRAPATEPADAPEPTPVPRLALAALRGTLARSPQGSVPATRPEAVLSENGRNRSRPLKLYQPAHHRFYLVGASLVCKVPGLPERAVVPGGQEQLHFVLRRLLPEPASGGDPEDLREFAYVKDAEGARWQRVDPGTDARRSVAGEERLPVFPLPFHDDGGRPRTLWAGMVPVGRREEYVGATVERHVVAGGFASGQLRAVRGGSPPAPRASKQARLAQFQLEVAEPWKNLIRASHAASRPLAEPPPVGGGESSTVKRGRAWEHNLQQQHASWLILLDLADYLAAYLPDLWTVLESGGAGYSSLSPNRQALYDWLGAAAMPAELTLALQPNDFDPLPIRPPVASLLAALAAIRAPGVRERLEGAEILYTADTLRPADDPWPGFHFALAGLGSVAPHLPAGPYERLDTLAEAGAEEVEPGPVTPVPPADLHSPAIAEQRAAGLDRLTALVGWALDARPETDAPRPPFAMQVRDALRSSVGDAGWFTVRFVYTRTDCGPLHPPDVSEPSQRFQIASFFDPDAPARPIRISLPTDTSPAGLRRFDKNTAFVISDLLCGQIQRAKGLGLVDLVRSVLPWPLHKKLDLGAGGACLNAGGANIGMICSLSIPIVTICALILLIIMVSILDYFFRWLPYFIMCFPIPGLSGKRASS